MIYIVKKELNLNYKIFGASYSFKVDPGHLLELRDDKSFRIKDQKFRSIIIRSRINKENTLKVCSSCDGYIPISDSAYENILEMIRFNRLIPE